jgi:serine/threonine-protein kinase
MNSYDCPHCRYTFVCAAGATGVVLCPQCQGSIVLPETELPNGTLIDDFKIIKLIGKGGMGNVYKAKQLSMDRTVAVKILLEELTRDKEYLEQFFKEVQVSGKLHHPNIISAISAGECNGLFYLATSYVNGLDLEERIIAEKFIPEKEALQIILKVADALKYAWDNFGMLHKDIKPANIMTNQKNEVFLMDMGIAQFISDGSGGEQMVQGSPYYMSPEQVTASKLSWSSDLYSLGATLYHILTSKPIFDAPEVESIIKMHAWTPFPDPNEVSLFQHLSAPTVELLRTTLEKKPEERFDSWMGFIEALEDAITHLNDSENKGKEQNPYSHTENNLKKYSKTKQKPSIKNKHHTHTNRTPIAGPGRGQAKNTSVLPLFALAIFLLIGAGAYYFYNQSRNKSIIEYNKAVLIDNSPTASYQKKINVYQRALSACIGTEFESKLRTKFQHLKKEKSEQDKLAKEYKKLKENSVELIADGKYQEVFTKVQRIAIAIKDPVISRDIQEYLKMLKDGMNQK